MAMPPDSEVQQIYAECQENYDVGDSTAEWPNNLLSKKAVALRSGRLRRADAPATPEPSAARVEELRSIAAEAASIMEGVPVGMGSESEDPWFALWVAAGEGETPPELSESTAAEVVDWWFGSTLFPETTVGFLPLGGQDGLRAAMNEDDDEDPDDTNFRAQAATDQLLAWLADERFNQAGLLFIGNDEELSDIPSESYPPGTEMPGCVHPRAFVGQLDDGSLVGVFGYVVNT